MDAFHFIVRLMHAKCVRLQHENEEVIVPGAKQALTFGLFHHKHWLKLGSVLRRQDSTCCNDGQLHEREWCVMEKKCARAT